MQSRVPAPPNGGLPLPAFAPVPRKHRHDGWTPARQRAFIAALAETGSVTWAARRINMAPEGAYSLRRAPGAEEFRAAWEAALDHGVSTLADLAIDRAREGVEVPVYWRGEQVGTKRRYNDRLLMFLLKHHMPSRYGKDLSPGTKHPETLARETEEAKEKARRAREQEGVAWLDEGLKLYARKVGEERRHRIRGNIVAADYALRQLTHIELLLESLGALDEVIARTGSGGWFEYPDTNVYESPLTRELDARRRQAWAEAGEALRPTAPDYANGLPSSGVRSGPTLKDRMKRQTEIQAQIARLQAEWEACATEDAFERLAGH